MKAISNFAGTLLVASDHAAFEEKAALVEFFKSQKRTVVDLGTHSKESCHYPDYSKILCETLLKSPEKSTLGILLCGSGIGVSMVANRFKGIRAARCVSLEDARLSKAHNDANVLCLGSRVNSIQEMKDMIEMWLKTPFENGRHSLRLAQF